MSVKRKAEKVPESPATSLTIEEFIHRGGEVASDNRDKWDKTNEEVRFTLRIPKEMLDKIDEKRKERPGKISRNQWILDKIFLHLD